MATVMPDGKVYPPLPTMFDLPSEEPEEPGLPDEFHLYQPQLLRETFQPSIYPPERVFVGSDLNLYYSLQHTTWYKRPDWFAALGVSRLYEGHELRLSYVVWQEAAPPYLVVELLSPGKEQEDLGKTVHEVGEPPTKWMVYEQILGVPYYAVFNRYTDELHYFQLLHGHYREISPPEQRLWLPEAGLGLGLWQGRLPGSGTALVALLRYSRGLDSDTAGAGKSAVSAGAAARGTGTALRRTGAPTGRTGTAARRTGAPAGRAGALACGTGTATR